MEFRPAQGTLSGVLGFRVFHLGACDGLRVLRLQGLGLRVFGAPHRKPQRAAQGFGVPGFRFQGELRV